MNSKFRSINVSQCIHLIAIAVSYSNINIITDSTLPKLQSFAGKSSNQLLPLDWFCQQTSLVWLDLSYNDYSGKVPECLGLLPSLSWLFLSHNSLSQIVPSNYNRLITLDVSYNSLQDNFDDYNFPKLVTGIFSHNKLVGLIAYCNSVYLIDLYLDSNPIANTNQQNGWSYCSMGPVAGSFNLLDIRNTPITDAWECNLGYDINPTMLIQDGNVFCPTVISKVGSYPRPWNMIVSKSYYTTSEPCFEWSTKV